jgi:AraC family transcriptional regulator
MSATLAFDVTEYARGKRHPRHRHDELQLSLVLRGRVSETVGSKTEYGSALSVVAKDSDVTHENDFGSEGAVLVRLTLPGGILGDIVEERARSPEWRWTHDPRVANPFIRLASRAMVEGVSRFDASDADLLDLLAAFTSVPAPASRGVPPKWLDDTMTELRDSWHPALRVDEIARRAGVHPVYLARCLKRWYGTGVAEELRRLRMRAAAAALAQTDSTVSRIAHGSGFADEPHLCREFHRTVGLTPRRYRSLMCGLVSTP